MKKTNWIGVLFVSGLLVSCTPKPFSKLVFHDEFNGNGLPDKALWNYEEGYIRNGEKQYYTVGRLENCYQKDGYLHLVIRNDSALIDGKIRPITSASVHTKSKGRWLYGKIEVRAKLPSCLGTWPAIWMLPAVNHYGKWPKSGEIDIMEHVGYDPEKIHFTVHSEKYNHTKNTQLSRTINCLAATSDFHVYGLEWRKDRLVWYFDGEQQYSVEKTEDTKEAWPFDQAFYLILNSAFGGGWGGQKGVDLARLPQEYLIDYVRVYQ
ncbi:MAG: glycoside hydrolase family 16 protein [Candidatus Symbiothrix sp.]|jgi:beta-glucanase (GH16 family)|nr:glycoside hydrolase family 16 protein [Candidatus Symbiothrix sp.]